MTRNGDGDDGSAGRQTTLGDLQEGDTATVEYIPENGDDIETPNGGVNEECFDTLTGKVVDTFNGGVEIQDGVFVGDTTVGEIDGQRIGVYPNLETVE